MYMKMHTMEMVEIYLQLLMRQVMCYYIQSKIYNNQQQLARTNKETIKPYENPEWQADTFAAELLMPASMITEDDTVFTVARRFGVSYSAARIRLNKLGIINA